MNKETVFNQFDGESDEENDSQFNRSIQDFERETLFNRLETD